MSTNEVDTSTIYLYWFNHPIKNRKKLGKPDRVFLIEKNGRDSLNITGAKWRKVDILSISWAPTMEFCYRYYHRCVIVLPTSALQLPPARN